MSDLLSIIEVGTRLEFDNAVGGEVVDVMQKVEDFTRPDRTYAEKRLHIMHYDGHQSFYNFRCDGRCSREPDMDITAVTNDS